MTLEERIAEALGHDSWCELVEQKAGPNPPYPYRCSCDTEAKARAVVAVLPTADVSDAQIQDAICAALEAGGPRANERGTIKHNLTAMTPAIRALLDAQAATHAAKVERTESMANAAVDRALRAEATADELRAALDGEV